ncbi:uncharacterized protein LOC141599036 isoform X1 [Silene latifolia]|uniref:uncharacterized protein LOC141599036 isoform X1 n=1 Tax=Silene latifolia TaxID=37657 RepID=UPI003D77C480
MWSYRSVITSTFDTRLPPLDLCASPCFDLCCSPCSNKRAIGPVLTSYGYKCSCILQVWNHGSPFQPCKCPMCCSHIKSLTPLASTNHYNEDGAEATLKTIEKYNHLFVGGIRGIIPKLRETPLLAKRMFRDMTDPDQAYSNQFHKWRCFAVVLALLYMISPFNFIPPDVNIIQVCNCFAFLVVGFLKLHGVYTRRRSAQRARQMAARPPV